MEPPGSDSGPSNKDLLCTEFFRISYGHWYQEGNKGWPPIFGESQSQLAEVLAMSRRLK